MQTTKDVIGEVLIRFKEKNMVEYEISGKDVMETVDKLCEILK